MSKLTGVRLSHAGWGTRRNVFGRAALGLNQDNEQLPMRCDESNLASNEASPNGSGSIPVSSGSISPIVISCVAIIKYTRRIITPLILITFCFFPAYSEPESGSSMKVRGRTEGVRHVVMDSESGSSKARVTENWVLNPISKIKKNYDGEHLVRKRVCRKYYKFVNASGRMRGTFGEIPLPRKPPD
ncbi:hypothetical protein M405DRAFT_838974 [Rhizopogon salebrosus TDB-379]|nr:hypothetical protein M405DRAFT_838974 [Rhizopogon salebrosus TDB-379]